MSPGNHLLLLLAAFLPLVGNQVDPTLPETVTVTQGELAVLHYDFSAFPSTHRPKTDLFISCSNFNGASKVHVCDLYKGKSHALGDFSTQAEISRLKDTNHLYRLTINQTRFSDQGVYTCEISGGSPRDSRRVHLAIKGRVENCELAEGADLTIDLSLSSCYIEFYGKQQSVTVCQVENGQVIEAAEEYRQRLSMQNGTLILGELTAKDHGNYTVWDESGQRVILTLTVEIKTKPLGVQTTEWDWRTAVLIVGLLVVSAVAAVVLVKVGIVGVRFIRRRRRKAQRASQTTEQTIPLKEIKSTTDTENDQCVTAGQ
ncbi:hypothetical protein GJAV_G00000750 [Gymnothorax javanicus]|nr:hypothetical protein GJAV_G00000750 [Gymnothorax javanicus]